jgi:hypothetical protein
VSVSAVLYPKWPPLLKIDISSNGQNCSILSQKLPKFELYKHNDELFNIYYGIFMNLEVGITGHNCGRGPSKDHSTKVWLQLAQWFLRTRFLCEFPIGVVLFQNCVRHFRAPTKMAATAELNLT